MNKAPAKKKEARSPTRRQAETVRERRAWEKESRRERITELAGRLFCSEAYHTITMERMAAMAGYCKRTLYFYFRDKEDLFAAVVLRHLKTVNEMLRDNEQSHKTGLEKLRGIGEVYFRFCIEEPQSFNLLFMFDHMNGSV